MFRKTYIQLWFSLRILLLSFDSVHAGHIRTPSSYIHYEHVRRKEITLKNNFICTVIGYATQRL